MRDIESYLREYQESHQNPLNVKIHNICVPLIMWSLFVFLTAFTFKIAEISIPFSTLLLLAVAFFYGAVAPWPLTLIMLLISVGMMATTFVLPHPREASVVIFILSWIGQFYGHKVEGKKPSFFKDILFLLVGPSWVLRKILP